MTATEKSRAAILKPEELAFLIRTFRDSMKWSQETLSALSGLSVRTIQRVEKGEPSDQDTRRALARAFEFEDIDAFNKPFEIPSADELEEQRKKFERDFMTLDAMPVRSGKELGKLSERSTMDCFSEQEELTGEAAAEFAMIADYFRDFRDSAELYSEVDKLDIYAEIQQHLDALDRNGIGLCYAVRETKLVGKDWVNKTPMPVTLVYITAGKKGNLPERFVVAKAIRF